MRKIAAAYIRYRRLNGQRLIMLYHRHHDMGASVLLTREAIITDLLVYRFGHAAVECWIKQQVLNESSATRVKKA